MMSPMETNGFCVLNVFAGGGREIKVSQGIDRWMDRKNGGKEGGREGGREGRSVCMCTRERRGKDTDQGGVANKRERIEQRRMQTV